MRPEQVTVVEPGVDEQFSPSGQKSDHPLVVAVGRLVPYKRFDLLIDSLVELRRRQPNLQAVIAGEGSERERLEALVRDHGAEGWLRLPGRLDDDGLIELYRRAWLLLSSSAYEGWGMTITEAAACGTPAIASPISGHMDSVIDGVSGYLAQPGPAMEDVIEKVLASPLLRRRLERGALQRAQKLTWEHTAVEIMKVLARDALRRSDGALDASDLL
jgi:glycosyltransferase involved in cell wall biosynthesis